TEAATKKLISPTPTANSSTSRRGIMQTRMTLRVLLMLVAMWMSTQTSSHAQERGQAAARPGRPAPPNMPGDFTFIPKADLEVLMGPTRGDRPARVVNIGNANLGAYILHYPVM